MRVTSLILWSAATALSGFLSFGHPAQAAEVKVLTSVALTSALDELAPIFEKETGNKLMIEYSLIATLRKRILDGETGDIIMLSRPVMEELQKQGKFAGDIVNVAGTPVSIVARAGAPKPDIGSVDALKRTLLNARSIVYADPAKGGASGVYFAKVVDQLGLTDELKAKTILVPGAQAPELVAKGEAELGVAQGSEIIPVAGAEVLGPLPGNLGSVTLFTAGIAAASTAPDAAKAFIKFITGQDAAPVLKAKGFEPG